ncbi:MAG: short-chain dehydrogenase/reductase [Acidimicrobiia bacterium]|nr:short-chain dehydrogenase/reductase [Acidimicrobiia bacterium]
MDFGIAGKRAVVAASSKGLGLGAAAALAAEGATVVISGRDDKRLQAVAAQLGQNVMPVVADVSTGTGAEHFLHEAIDMLGGIDILVTNGPGPTPGDFAATPMEAYPDALELNLLSVVAMCKLAVPLMQAQHWGRVVAITSVAVRQPIANLILSTTARAGVTGFLKVLAREVAADGVTVNSLQPGLHATDRVKQLHSDLGEAAQGVPAGRLGDPSDFGAAVAFLCSQQANFITGTGLLVDGGAYAGLM